MAYTYAQAAKRLGWSMRTFTKWREAAGIEGKTPAYYGNRRLLSDEDVEAIRRYREQAREEAGLGGSLVRPYVPLPAPIVLDREDFRKSPRRMSTRFTQDAGELPAGWIAYTTWCDVHHINEQSADRLISRGRLTQPQHSDDGWRGRTGQRIHRAYDLDQHREASHIASQEWPARFVACADCGSLPEE